MNGQRFWLLTTKDAFENGGPHTFENFRNIVGVNSNREVGEDLALLLLMDFLQEYFFYIHLAILLFATT